MTAASVPPASAGVRIARRVLIAAGAVLVAVAGWLLTVEVSARQWPGILLWLAGAVVLHDAVFAPLVLVGTRLLRRAGARTSWAAVAVVQVALVIGGAITAIAIPGIRSQQLGAQNDSVLVFPYVLHLGVAWAALAVVTAAVVLALSLRRRRARP